MHDVVMANSSKRKRRPCGIDEISVRKGHAYRIVASDLVSDGRPALKTLLSAKERFDTTYLRLRILTCTLPVRQKRQNSRTRIREDRK